MRTISQEEFKKKYGESAIEQFNLPVADSKVGYLDRVINTTAEDINKRIDRFGEIRQRQDTNMLEKGVQMFGQGTGLAAKTLETTVGEIPGVKQAVGAIGSGINWLATSDYSPAKHLGDIFGESKTLQEVTKLYDTDKNFKDTVDGVANIARLGGDVSSVVEGANYVKNVTNKVISNIRSTPIDPTATIDRHFKTAKMELSDPEMSSRFSTPDGMSNLINRTKTNIVDGLKAEKATQVANKISKLDVNSFSSLDDFKSAVDKLTQKVEAPKAVKPVSDVVEGVTAKNIVKDIVPTRERIVNTEITKALDLTQGDVKNINLSTGNDVGNFISENNLIGKTAKETADNIDGFKKLNYEHVRAEINAVKNTYQRQSIPRFDESLIEIKRQIQDTPGLQASNAEVDALLKKRIITLADVQRAKELLDEHFQLYKATGDVKEGVAKTGLSNIRRELKTFIEDEVMNSSGTDIKPLNNNVATARSISDAINTRSTRGLTRATISAADILTFLTGSGFATPLGGAVAVLVKKIYNSPTFKLQFAKWLDGLNDTKRIKIQESLKKGIVPKEIKIIQRDSSNSSSNLLNKNANTLNTKTTTPIKKSFIPKTVPQKVPKTQKLSPLIKEAKKYKSAEEFVKAQPTYYHTTKLENVSNIEKQGFSGKIGDMSKASGGNMQEGVFLYPEKSSAEVFGKNFKNPSIVETKVNGKVYDANTQNKYGWEDDLQTQEIAKDKKIIEQLRKDGYVGVQSTEMGTDAIFIFNPSEIKTKSQLEQIWKEANKK